MIKISLFACFLFLFYSLFAQDAKEILKQSYSNCQKIKHGYYEMRKSMKFMDSKDTNSLNTFTCYFSKLKNDSLFPAAFNYEQKNNGQYFENVLYTGKEYVTYSSKDSTGTIMSNAKWANLIMSKNHNDIFNFFTPFMRQDSYPLPKQRSYTNKKVTFNFIGNEIINDFNCYHIKMIEFPEYDSLDVLHNLETDYDYWINIHDSIPVKYSFSTKVLDNGDTLHEYFSYGLQKYKLSNLEKKDFIALELSSIPSYCKLTEYAPKTIELLPKESIAPDWTLVSLDNKKVSLADYKGHVTLIDFFYKNCYPCLRALPKMQDLYKKYNSKGLNVIGIDAVDKPEDGVKKYLLKRGINYPVFLDNKNVANDYHISGYPTVYLIDKNGKIIFTHVGYADGDVSVLEEILKTELPHTANVDVSPKHVN